MIALLFTEEELAALRDEFFPRMLVASVCADNPAAARAVYRIDPKLLPWTTRFEIQNEESARR